METRSKKRKRIANDNIINAYAGIQSEDRLSSLPDPILADILSLIPIKSAVATAVLSRRWRFLWKQITGVRHDGFSVREFFAVAAGKILPELISPAIDSFEFFGTNPRPPGMGRFSSFIFQLCHRRVRKIDVKFSVRDCGYQIPLPSCVFECESLETLFLDEGFQFKLPDNGIRVPNLKELHVDVCDHDFDLMINVFKSCPRLEKLQVKGVIVSYRGCFDIHCPNLKWLRLNLVMRHPNLNYDDLRVVIHAPKLEHLDIRSNYLLRYSFAEIPSCLVEAKFITRLNSLSGAMGYKCDLLPSIDNVKSLTLGGDIFLAVRCLAACALPTFHSLTSFTGYLRSPSCWKGMMYLLTCCPNLRVLVLRKDVRSWKGIMSCSAFDYLPDCLSTSVKRIKLERLEGVEHELGLISFFLRNAKALETLEVDVASSSWKTKEAKLSEEYVFCQELCRFPRHSSGCQISFSGQYYRALSKGCDDEAPLQWFLT